MSTHRLKQQREPILTALREIRDAASAAGTLTPEQQSKADELRAKLADLDKRIDLDALIEEQERRMTGVALTNAAGGDRFAELAGEEPFKCEEHAQLVQSTPARADSNRRAVIGRVRSNDADLVQGHRAKLTRLIVGPCFVIGSEADRHTAEITALRQCQQIVAVRRVWHVKLVAEAVRRVGQPQRAGARAAE